MFSILTKDDISTINAILYVHFVTEEGIYYKPPFREGTARYLEGMGVDGDVLFLEKGLIEYANGNFDYSDRVLSLLDCPIYSKEELIALGKFLPEDL